MRIIQTEDKILTGDNHPQLQIGDKLYLVDNRKKTFDKINEVQSDVTLSQNEKERKIFEFALGEVNAREILDNDELTVSGYKNLSYFILAAITGNTFEEIKEQSEQKN